MNMIIVSMITLMYDVCMKEKDIMYENGLYWVGRTHDSYTVFKIGSTHSTSDSSYALSDDGLSIAIVRCNFLEARRIMKHLTEQHI